MVKRIWATLMIVIGIQHLLFAAAPLQAKTDKIAPSFSLSDLNGKVVALADYKDKDVILFFWTTWCPYCVREIKTIKEKSQQLKNDGVTLLLIDIGESKLKVENFVKRNNLDVSVLLDEKAEVSDAYELMGVPTFVLIDKKGNIKAQANNFPKDYKNILLK